MAKREEWEEIVEKYGDSLYRYALAVLGTEADAKDATHDAFIKIFKGSLKEKEKEKQWIFTIIRNTCRDRQRFIARFAKFTFSHLGSKPEWISSPVEPLTMKTKEALNSLPKRQREVFVLRHIHEFSTEETAEVLNISEGSVKSHLSRAITALQEKFANG